MCGNTVHGPISILQTIRVLRNPAVTLQIHSGIYLFCFSWIRISGISFTNMDYFSNHMHFTRKQCVIKIVFENNKSCLSGASIKSRWRKFKQWNYYVTSPLPQKHLKVQMLTLPHSVLYKLYYYPEIHSFLCSWAWSKYNSTQIFLTWPTPSSQGRKPARLGGLWADVYLQLPVSLPYTWIQWIHFEGKKNSSLPFQSLRLSFWSKLHARIVLASLGKGWMQVQLTLSEVKW